MPLRAERAKSRIRSDAHDLDGGEPRGGGLDHHADGGEAGTAGERHEVAGLGGRRHHGRHDPDVGGCALRGACDGLHLPLEHVGVSPGGSQTGWDARGSAGGSNSRNWSATISRSKAASSNSPVTNGS